MSIVFSKADQMENFEMKNTFTIISDTHCRLDPFKDIKSDYLLICGDFLNREDIQKEYMLHSELDTLVQCLSELPVKHILVVFGNHEYPVRNVIREKFRKLSNVHLLEDSQIIIEEYQFFGFSYPVKKYVCKKFMNLVDPTKKQIVLAHEPPRSILDLFHNEYRDINEKIESIDTRMLVKKLSTSRLDVLEKYFSSETLMTPNQLKRWKKLDFMKRKRTVEKIIHYNKIISKYYYNVDDEYVELGSKKLSKFTEILKPQLCCFGHSHHSYGVKEIDNTKYINASIVDEMQENVRPLITLSLPKVTFEFYEKIKQTIHTGSFKKYDRNHVE